MSGKNTGNHSEYQKARSRTPDGRTLEAIEPGGKPDDRFYVQGTHEMSFDSRYRVNGLVRRDQIIGKAEVVIKGLGEGLKELKGISGGAILGDGQIGLILDPEGLFELSEK